MDDLEVFVASGLDIPTAIVVSEQGKPPERQSGCGVIVAIAVVVALLLMVLRCL